MKQTFDLCFDKNYLHYGGIISDAYFQMAYGKGRARHNPENQDWDDQIMIATGVRQKTNHGMLYQIIKKVDESTRLPYPESRMELIHAINHLAGAVRILDLLNSVEPEEKPLSCLDCGSGCLFEGCTVEDSAPKGGSYKISHPEVSLSAEDIKLLEEKGYTVEEVCDCDGC